MSYVIERFFGWMDNEPFIGLLMIVAALALFLGAWRRSAAGAGADSPWGWSRRLVAAGAAAALFLGVLWAFRALLNDNTRTFAQTHGRVSEANYQSLLTIWGRPHEQRELAVRHWVEVEQREELPRPDPALPPVFRTVKVSQDVEQNSILSARGEVTLTLNQRRKGSAYYNGFESLFDMEYVVANEAAHGTNAELFFPLAPQALYEDLKVEEDGADISRDLRVSSAGLRWSRQLKAGERRTVKVHYRTRGVEHFYYQIPQPREVRAFSLALTVPALPVAEVNYPEGCLTPSAVDPTADGRGTVLRWTLDRSVTTAGMGVALPKPDQPGAKVGVVLARSPYALMLLVVSVCLTFLLRSKPVELLEVSLLSAAYSVLFLVMAAASDFFPGVWTGFWGSIALGSALTLMLAWRLFRGEPRLTRGLVLALVAFFTLIYPVIGLLPDAQASFDGFVVVGLLIYLFVLSISAKLGPGRAGSPGGEHA